MSSTSATLTPTEIHYPDSDGNPTADNTLQWQWMVTIKENLEDLFREDPDVFVAGDLLWYPVEGSNQLRAAPDVLVALADPRATVAPTGSGRKTASLRRSSSRSSPPATVPARW